MTNSTSTGLTAVILTALPVELQAVQQHLHDIHEVMHPAGTIYTCGTFPTPKANWKVAIVQIGPGNPGAAFEAERAIQHFQPQIVLFVGVAGGLKIKDVRLGDAVAATKVYGYEFGKVAEIFQARPEVGNVTYPMEQRIRSEAYKDEWKQRIKCADIPARPKVLVGAIAAGEKVLKSRRSELVAFLQATYEDALAVEMEGYGFLKATHANHQVNALVVRGISDLIEGKDEADKQNWQEIASCIASAFAFEVLAKCTPYELARLPQTSSASPPAPAAQPTPSAGNTVAQFHGSVQNVAVGENNTINNTYQYPK